MKGRKQALLELRETAIGDLENLKRQRTDIADKAERNGREELSPEEDREFRDKTQEIAKKQTEVKGFDERIKELSDEEARAGDLDESAIAVRQAQGSSVVVNEARTYVQGDPRCSYLQDFARKQMGMDSDGRSGERLHRHARDVATGQEYRDLDRTDGNGGYAVPPKWLVDQFITLARPGRAYANIVNQQKLPAGTDSLNIPKITSGTSAAIQTGDNSPVSETDLDDASIEAKVRTIAGQQDLAIQLLDQSPISFDAIIFADLAADYATKLDRQALAGTGGSGQVLGVHGTSGIETVTISGGATVKKFYAAVADAVQRIHTLRFQPPTHIVMHPRRWAWLTAEFDEAGRPLVVPAAQVPTNAAATQAGVISEGMVGTMQGLPIIVDANIGTTYGEGAEDVAYVQRSSDIFLWESEIRTRVLPEVGSGNLTVRLQLYGYCAFTAGRYPKSIAEITGLGAPSF